MKLLKTFFVLSFCLIFAEESTTQNKKNLKDLFKDWNLGINGHIGQISPITSTDRSAFNPGRNIGLSIQAPKPIKLHEQSTTIRNGSSHCSELFSTKHLPHKSSDQTHRLKTILWWASLYQLFEESLIWLEFSNRDSTCSQKHTFWGDTQKSCLKSYKQIKKSRDQRLLHIIFCALGGPILDFWGVRGVR